MAIQDIKQKTFQTTKYQRAMEALNAELTKQGQPTLPLDQQWLTETRKKSLTVFEQLEAQVIEGGPFKFTACRTEGGYDNTQSNELKNVARHNT